MMQAGPFYVQVASPQPISVASMNLAVTPGMRTSGKPSSWQMRCDSEICASTEATVTVTETDYKGELVERLKSDFDFRFEVPGMFLVDGTQVIIDILAHPKPHLIERGFIAQWFGVEVKLPTGEKQMLRVAWQAITYSMSEFNGIRPAFVLIYPPLDTFSYDQAQLYLLRSLLQKSNVGEFVLNDAYWRISFTANYYFDSRRGITKIAGLGTKRHVGTWR